MMSIFLLALAGLLPETTVVHGLLFNVAHIILGWIFSLLFSDFKEKHSNTSNSSIGVFPCRCHHKCPSITGIIVNYTRMLCAVLNKSGKQHTNKTTVVWSFTSHLTSQPSKMNKTCWALLKK